MMKKTLVILALFFSTLFIMNSYAYPSGNTWPPVFEKKYGAWYDKPWGVNRNVWYGEDGYLPSLAYESLGYYVDLAYSWGEDFKRNYPDRLERAQAVLSFVQRWTEYGHDGDNVVMEGEPQGEWAWNPDEMAHMIEEARAHGTVAEGDCEDFAFFCAILYLAAGFDVAIVEAPQHVALLIWLPQYPDANIYWDILDGRSYGWIWVEATGDHNPLGWTPPDYSDGFFDTYVIESETPVRIRISNIRYSPTNPTSQDEIYVTAYIEYNQTEIVEVSLAYSVQNGTQNIVPMNFVGNATYEGTIPKQKEGDKVEFCVQARDKLENEVESAPVTYRVSETRLLPREFYLLVLSALSLIPLLVLVVVLGHKKR